MRSCPRALARRLEALGHVAEHVADRNLSSASDDVIRDYAADVGSVIVTKDEDFAVRRLLTGGPAVVWLRLGNTRRTTLLARASQGRGRHHVRRRVRTSVAGEARAREV